MSHDTHPNRRPTAPGAANPAKPSLGARLIHLLGGQAPAAATTGAYPEDRDPRELERTLGYRFKNRALLEEALTHPSRSLAVKHTLPHNQRLEFLGDAVIGLVLARKLFQKLPGCREGELTRRRSELVRAETLAAAADELGVFAFLRFGPIRDTEREAGRQRALCDAFEALTGAVFLDAGYEAAEAAVLRWLGAFDAAMAGSAAAVMNPKGALQEKIQPLLGNTAVRYEIVEVSGPDHKRRFTVRVLVQEEECGRGSGDSKKAAEEEAARMALARLAAGDAQTERVEGA